MDTFSPDGLHFMRVVPAATSLSTHIQDLLTTRRQYIEAFLQKHVDLTTIADYVLVEGPITPADPPGSSDQLLILVKASDPIEGVSLALLSTLYPSTIFSWRIAPDPPRSNGSQSPLPNELILLQRQMAALEYKQREFGEGQQLASHQYADLKQTMTQLSEQSRQINTNLKYYIDQQARVVQQLRKAAIINARSDVSTGRPLPVEIPPNMRPSTMTNIKHPIDAIANDWPLNVKHPIVRAGYVTEEQVRYATDKELLAIPMVGKAALRIIRSSIPFSPWTVADEELLGAD